MLSFASASRALGGDWDKFHADFDAWREGLADCDASSLNASLRGFAARFVTISDAAGKLPRHSIVRGLADKAIAAAQQEEDATRGLRDNWRPADATVFEAVETERAAASGSRPVKWCKSASSCCCCLGGCRLREIGLRKSFVEGQNGGCEVSTSDDPFVVLLSQDGANEAAHGRPVREDAHHIGASPDLLVETLLWVVGPELLPVGEWEAGEGQDVGSRFVQ